MSENKKVSVVIPCYNAAKWLPQCFLSLVNQTIGIKNLELIFVNDASTDQGATLALLQEMERGYPENILVINMEENMRQGGARNIGLTYAAGEYLGFVDADDWVDLTLFEKAYEKARENDADIVQFSHKVYVDGVGELPGAEQGSDYFVEITSIEQRKKMLMEEQITYGCWNKLYRRSMVAEAGVQYAQHMPYEEPLFVYPLLFYAARFVVMKDRLYYYRQNKAGTMYRDMKAVNTLYQHSKVQRLVLEFMKKKDFFIDYEAEIIFYFIHTYFYETLYFARLRELELPYRIYKELAAYVKAECPDYLANPYLKQAPAQKQLLEFMDSLATQEDLNGYINAMPVFS